MGALGLSPPQGFPRGTGGGSGIAGIIVEDEGIVEGTDITTLNFIGAAVTAVDQGAGVVDVTISGAAVEAGDIVPILHAFGEF